MKMGSMSGDDLANWDAQSSSGHDEKIYVSVRVRPLNEKEISRNDVADWECINNNTIIYKNSIADRSMFPTAYTFDRVFSWDHSTKQVYEEGAREVTLSVLSGINSTVFAYGQTNSGKTYTMSGITDYTIADIYDYIDKHNDREFVLKFSAMEIYNEAVRDLLSTDSTPLRLLDDPERGTVVEKLTEEVLRDCSHLKELLAVCEAQRKIGETSLNELSSRSHQILRLTIESSAREFKGAANSSTLTASVNFVDLAGSERASQTLSAGARLKEGCHINRSLLTLGTVIRKLSKGRNGHVPYRDSKLTRILQNSLGGNARTAIICTMSPARSLVEQSRNTLFFASCAKEVSTNAQVNLVMSDKALVKQLQRELVRMENEVKSLASKSAIPSSAAVLKEKELLIEKMEKEIKELKQQRDLAEARVQDLLRSVAEFQVPRSLVSALSENHRKAVARLRASTMAEHKHQLELDTKSSRVGAYPASESSEVVESLRSDITAHPSPLYDRCDSLDNKPNFLLHDQAEDHFLSNDISPRQAIDELFGPDPSQGWEMTVDTHDEDPEDCKEVRCIEVREPNIERNITSDAIASPEKDKVGENDHHISSEPSYEALKKKIQDMQQTIDYLVNPILMPPSPSSSEGNMSVTRSMTFSRSRSCRAVLTPNSSSHWFERAERNAYTPPNGSVRYFPGRPEGCCRVRQYHVPRACSLEEFNLEDSHGSSNASSERKGRKTNLSCESDILDRYEIINSGFQYGPSMEFTGNDSHLPVEGASVDVNDISSEKKDRRPNLSFGSDISEGRELKNSEFEYDPHTKELNGDDSRLSVEGATSDLKEQNTRITCENDVSGDYELEQSGSKRAASTEELSGKGSHFSVEGASLDEKDQNAKSSSEDDVSNGYLLKHPEVEHAASTDKLSGQDSEVPVDRSSSPKYEQSKDILDESNVNSGQSSATKSDEVVSSVHHSGDSSVKEAKIETNVPEKCGEDISLGSVQGSKESPSDWVVEFETRQRKIIELWEACYVPLTHRTQFFLLFKGDDPSDSVYFEVELRRLSFLKSTLSRGTKVLMDGQILTPELSKRSLHRERQLLSKQMLRMFSGKEREGLYQKWGIKLNSKQRRQQLCHRIWTDSKDMNHVRESATIVAKLVGFAEMSQTPKEMFGLSFSRRPVNHNRSFSWKPSMPLNL